MEFVKTKKIWDKISRSQNYPFVMYWKHNLMDLYDMIITFFNRFYF